MRQPVIPLLAPLIQRQSGPDAIWEETHARGFAVLNSPQLNKGTAFSAEERIALGLTGLLPPGVGTLAGQVKAAYLQYERLPDALSRNIYLTALHDRNEVLFYKLFSEHLREMIPIVNDLTVGMAMAQYHHECRRPRGVYLSIDHPESIDDAFGNLEAAGDDIDLVLATDAENVPGLGDWGIGGIEIAIGKLAIYTAAGGIDPARTIPVMLDVGTNRQSLRADPMYIGNRHTRIGGDRYDEFIDAYVRAVTQRFPHAVLQWEDFAPGNGRRILERCRDHICTFNDDLQGTGAITLAAIVSAVRVCGVPLRNHRIVIMGAGMAGMGVAEQLRDAMVREGLSAEDATRRFWCLNEEGLMTSDDLGRLPAHQLPFARAAGESTHWMRPTAGAADSGGVSLAEVVRRVKPTILIGASPTGGAFTEVIVRDMAANTDRPIIFALCLPSTQVAAYPADLIKWTSGRALIATGSPFAPITYKGVTYVIAHAANAILYPGLCLGAIVARTRTISPGMIAAAASAVSSLVTVRQPGASLLPQISDLRDISVTVAAAVVEAAESEGLARVRLNDIVQQVRDSMWEPEYRPLRAI